MTLTLNVGSFNVRWDDPRDGGQRWEHRRARVLNLLRGWEPDVLGLQEPLRGQLDDIRQALPKYGCVGVGREDGLEAGEFCPILYRAARFSLDSSGTFWFSDTPEIPSRTWGNRVTRICTWARLVERDSGTALFVFNVHLDHESQTAREKSVRLLLSRIRERQTKDSVIVTGDFNAEPDNPAISLMSAPNSAVPVSALAAFPQETGGTFHGFTGEAGGGRIDHIFLSPDWRIVHAEVLRGDGLRPFLSDHFPIAATLSL